MANIAEDIPQEVLINLNSAEITAGGTTDLAGFDDPRNIINRTDGVDGAGKTWLLADNTAGYWQADLTREGTPSLLRLSNTKQDGRGTKAFTFSWFIAAVDDNPPGLANLTYTDPQTGKAAFCAEQCPLAASSNKSYQDFLFVNNIKLNNIRLNVTQWYGAGGGLDGLLLAENPLPIETSSASSPSSASSSSPTQADQPSPSSAVAATTTVTPPPSPSNGLSSGSKAGIAIGVIIFVLLLLAALWLWLRRYRKARNDPATSSRHEDGQSGMGRQELDANTTINEKEAGVLAREMDADAPLAEIDNGDQAHEIGGEHWKREMDGQDHARNLQKGQMGPPH
ncbi:MAG: hypothetical protein Q9219_001405 [cf. Caloplaca sp. 3 TL-2023]